jgi:hypothetical protein
MDSVEEIEAAITKLPPDEYRRFVRLVPRARQTNWDEQLDRDSIAGKLDLLFREAEDESRPRLADLKVRSVATRNSWALFQVFPRTGYQESSPVAPRSASSVPALPPIAG